MNKRKSMKYTMLKILVILSALATGIILGDNRKCDCAAPFHFPRQLDFETVEIKVKLMAPIAVNINTGKNKKISGKTYPESGRNFHIIENTK